MILDIPSWLLNFPSWFLSSLNDYYIPNPSQHDCWNYDEKHSHGPRKKTWGEYWGLFGNPRMFIINMFPNRGTSPFVYYCASHTYVHFWRCSFGVIDWFRELVWNYLSNPWLMLETISPFICSTFCVLPWCVMVATLWNKSHWVFLLKHAP